MLLDDLVRVIESLKERITIHSGTLRENETRTRMALIDPLLQALGWDTSDPAVVLPEYDVSGRKADYALLQEDGNPAATIEAKKLGENLASHRMQMLNYANASDVEYAGLTDGDKWELYEVFKRGQLEDRRILDISIADTPIHEAALKLLLLWRPNLASRQPVSANTPSNMEEPGLPPAPYPVPTPGNWTPLNLVEAGKGRKPPAAIKLTNEELYSVKSWIQVLIEVAEWLVKVGRLTSEHRPMKGLSFINSSPVRLGGTPYAEYREISGGLYVNTDLTAIQVVSCSQRLLIHYGINPETIELQFE